MRAAEPPIILISGNDRSGTRECSWVNLFSDGAKPLSPVAVAFRSAAFLFAMRAATATKRGHPRADIRCDTYVTAGMKTSGVRGAPRWNVRRETSRRTDAASGHLLHGRDKSCNGSLRADCDKALSHDDCANCQWIIGLSSRADTAKVEESLYAIVRVFSRTIFRQIHLIDPYLIKVGVSVCVSLSFDPIFKRVPCDRCKGTSIFPAIESRFTDVLIRRGILTGLNI